MTQIKETPVEARGARKNPWVRRVLVISIVLAIVALVIVAFVT